MDVHDEKLSRSTTEADGLISKQHTDGHVIENGQAIENGHVIENEQAVENKEPTQKKPLSFPTAFTILLGLTLIIAVLTWIIPAGQYQMDANGRPIPGTYHSVPRNPQRLVDVVLAPVDGMYALRSAGTDSQPASVSVNNPTGSLFGAIAISLFILVMGGFITMTLETGAINAGIGAILKRFQSQGHLLIPILMIAFALGGTTFGLSEETLGFIVIVNAIMIALGYDVMVSLATVGFGATLGSLASTVNPFSTGVASGIAGISTGDGIVLRMFMWVVMVGTGIFFVMRYASRVKKNPEISVVADQREEHRRQFLGENPQDLPEMTNRHKVVLIAFALTFLVLIYSVIPWDDFGINWLPTLGWSFGQFTALFAIGAVVIGIIAGYNEKKIVGTFVRGASDFVSPALVVAIARGITVVMENGLITATILYSIEGLLKGTSSFTFAALMYIFNIPLAFLVPSSSGLAALSMPILGPLAGFAGVPKSIVVTAFQSAAGTLNLITPTSAVVMGRLAISNVGYERFIRFAAPLVGIVIVLCILIIGFAAVIAG